MSGKSIPVPIGFRGRGQQLVLSFGFHKFRTRTLAVLAIDNIQVHSISASVDGTSLS